MMKDSSTTEPRTAEKGASARPPSSAAIGCVRRNLFQRIFGIPATESPADAESWSFADGTIKVDMTRASELGAGVGAIRLESPTLPVPVLLIHGVDGGYHAFENRCTHGGRKLDPCMGGPAVQCCSVGRSTFDYEGKILSGPAKSSIHPYPVRVEGETLLIEVR
jgi:nitrite reductase/ring-hydroxylating ferredoxin subunit